MTTLHLRKKSIGRSPLRRGCLLIAFALCCFALSPAARAVIPPPDGGYPNQNTAEGDGALLNLVGSGNTAIGASALASTINASYNTAVGFFALFQNETGRGNTASGASALGDNRTGSFNTASGTNALINNNADNNTATGAGALQNNTTGNSNTADGVGALGGNSGGSKNTANGISALQHNTTGNNNTATGAFALGGNSGGSKNTANGISALQHNTTGNENTAIGNGALGANTTGSFNTGVGTNAGANLTTGSNNIDIGDLGVAGESNTMRIGGVRQTSTFIAGIYGATVPGGAGIIIDSTGHVGTVVSSMRFKDQIKPMDKASESILALKPVTFHYKKEIDPDRVPQFGLVAEDVAKVNPDLVVRDKHGEICTVRYDVVNAMLLNEFLKEHRALLKEQHKVEVQEKTIAELKSGMTALAARVKEQASQIQKVSAQLEASKPSPQVVNNP